MGNLRGLFPAIVVAWLALAVSAFASVDPAPVTVSSIDALTHLARGVSAKYKNVSVVGYHEGSREGGGLFIWDASSTESADGCTIFQAADATGRWKRTGSLNLMHSKWCGAVGNGTNDDTGPINGERL